MNSAGADFNPNLQGPNVVNARTAARDCELLFGDEPVIRIEVDCLSWEDVAVAAGFFPSRTQARKNGWIGEVPAGFGQRRFGKGRGVWFFNSSAAIVVDHDADFC